VAHVAPVLGARCKKQKGNKKSGLKQLSPAITKTQTGRILSAIQQNKKCSEMQYNAVQHRLLLPPPHPLSLPPLPPLPPSPSLPRGASLPPSPPPPQPAACPSALALARRQARALPAPTAQSRQWK
jgi:hypothetical protein